MSVHDGCLFFPLSDQWHVLITKLPRDSNVTSEACTHAEPWYDGGGGAGSLI